MGLRRFASVLLTGLALAAASTVGTAGVAAAAPPVTAQEILGDIRTATSVTDQFWRTHWSELFTGTYRAPEVKGLYDGRSASTSLECRTPAGSGLLPPDNAVYCPDVRGPYVAFDVNLMARALNEGDAFVYLVVAHEWGHAVADQLDASLKFEAGELQADCLAGAALYGAAADGTVRFEPGDEQEIAAGLTSLADQTAWTKTSDHGDPFERISNFNVGRVNGVSACLRTS